MQRPLIDPPSHHGAHFARPLLPKLVPTSTVIRCVPLNAGGAQLRLLAQRAKHLERCVATARHAHFYMDLSVH